jgi:hypothetical protein
VCNSFVSSLEFCSQTSHQIVGLISFSTRSAPFKTPNSWVSASIFNTEGAGKYSRRESKATETVGWTHRAPFASLDPAASIK